MGNAMENTKSVFGTYDNKELNKWYQIYASLYYNYVDSNLNHFFTRNMDIAPIRDCNDDEERMTEAYKKEAISLMHQIDSPEVLEEYPDLREFA